MADGEQVALKPRRGRKASDVNKIGESGDKASPQAGDNGGEFARRPYTLDQMQHEALADAKEDDRNAGEGKVAQEAFWRAAADRLGFNPVTVELGEGFADTGVFTAFPADNVVPAGTGDLHQQHETAVERLENLVDGVNLQTDGLVFDVRDFLMDLFKTRPKPWSAASAKEQRDIAAAAEHAAKELVRKVVEAIAAGRDASAIRALLESYTEKDGIKVTLKVKTLSEEEALAAVIGLHKAQGKHVMITVASADDYTGERRDPAIQPDEPTLEFEAGDDRDLAAGDAGNNIRLNLKTGYIDRREEPGGEWIQTDPAPLEDLAREGGGKYRCNLQSGMVEHLPDGHPEDDETAWADLREATPAELAAERERRADFVD